MNEFFIPLNTPSSKNSRQWTGKYFIVSKTVKKWREKTAVHWMKEKRGFINALKGKQKPYRIGFHFVRNSRRKYDWANPLQTITDEMVKYGWIDDDNIFEIVPFPYVKNGGYTTLNPKHAGVYIKIF